MMPHMDGKNLCKHIKEDPDTKGAEINKGCK